MINDMDNLKEYLESRLKPNKEKVKKFSEVFTPLETVYEMTEIFSGLFINPNATWCDPAAGIGHFLVVIYERLMEGL